MKKSLMLSLAMLPVMALAQNFKASHADLNIGQVRWNVPATATFVIQNTSKKTLTVKEVDAGCGCTSVNYPRQSIAPGQQFEMKATYDSRQLGHFARTISVWNSGEDKPIELVLRGQVVSDMIAFNGEYPFSVGGLLIDKGSVEFDDVNKGSVVSQEIHIMNPSDAAVSPVVMHLPSYLKAEFMPKTLGPKKSGVLRLTLNSSNLRLLGLNQASIYLAQSVGQKVSDDKEIVVSSILLPARTKTSVSGTGQPSIALSTDVIDMTDFQGKKKLTKEVTITNNGKAALDISSIQMFTQGLKITLPERQIQPGQSTTMKVTGTSTVLKKLRTRPRILMITNDPSMQKVIIEINK